MNQVEIDRLGDTLAQIFRYYKELLEERHGISSLNLDCLSMASAKMSKEQQEIISQKLNNLSATQLFYASYQSLVRLTEGLLNSEKMLGEAKTK